MNSGIIMGQLCTAGDHLWSLLMSSAAEDQFLTSKKADYINGEIIKIDGGEVVKNSGEFNFLTNIPFYR